MRTTVKFNYSLKEEGYNESDRKIEEKEFKAITKDNNATIKVVDDNTIIHEYETTENIGWYFRNMEDCIIGNN